MRNFFILLILLSCGSLSAQNFKGGLIAGINASQVSGDNLAGFDKLGFVFGGLTNLKFSKNFSGQLELLYNEKGSKTKAADSINLYKLTLRYLEVPVIIAYHYKKFKIEAGPAIGVLFDATEEDSYSVIEGRPFNTLEVSAIIGFDFNIWKTLWLNGRLSESITPIRMHASKETLGLNKGQANTVISFSLRYLFDVSQAE